MRMVRPISLLPQQIQTKRALISHMLAVFAGALIGAAVVFTAYTGLHELQVSSERAVSTAVVTGETQAESPLLRESQARVAALAPLFSRELRWQEVYAASGGVTAKDVTISSLSITRQMSQITVRISGISPSTLSYARYLETLRQNSIVSSISDESQSFNATTGTIAFNLIVNLKQGSLLRSSKPTL